MKNSELWALEWSQRGNNLHVQRLENTLSFNRRLYLNDTVTGNDFRVIHVGTYDECNDAADAIRNTINERDAKRRELA